MSSPELTAPARIVVAYQDGDLRSEWFQAVQRARRTLRRAGYRAIVDLVPASAIGDAAAVIAPEGLPVAQQRAGVPVLRAAAGGLGPVLDDVIDRLAAAGAIVLGPESPRTTATHRGMHPLGERGRLPEQP